MSDRVLFLLRHAEAEARPRGVHDADRALTGQGLIQARHVGEMLRQQQPTVESVLRSDALRVAETVRQLGLEAPVTVDGDIYEASPEVLLRVLASVPPAHRCVLLVGHAPGIPDLIERLVDRSGSSGEALDFLDTWYPTATLTRLEFAGSWEELAQGQVKAAAVSVSRGRADEN